MDSPACLVADEHDMSGNLARLLKAAGQKAPAAAPILEINPAHPVVLQLKKAEAKFDDWASVLLDQALLAEGGQLDDPATFVKRINALMLEMSGGGITDHPARVSDGRTGDQARARRAGGRSATTEPGRKRLNCRWSQIDPLRPLHRTKNRHSTAINSRRSATESPRPPAPAPIAES